MEAQERGRAPSDVVELRPDVVEPVGGADHEPAGQRPRPPRPRRRARCEARAQAPGSAAGTANTAGTRRKAENFAAKARPRAAPTAAARGTGGLLGHPEHRAQGEEGGQGVDACRRWPPRCSRSGSDRARRRSWPGRPRPRRGSAGRPRTRRQEQGERGHGGQARVEAQPVGAAHAEPALGRLAGDRVRHGARRLGVVVQDGEALRLARLHQPPRVRDVVGLVVGLALGPRGGRRRPPWRTGRRPPRRGGGPSGLSQARHELAPARPRSCGSPPGSSPSPSPDGSAPA